MIHPVTTLPLSSKHRVSEITFHPSRPYLAVQSHDRSVEIFRIRTEEEIRKKQARRLKRAKEKKEQAKAKSKAQDGQAQDQDMDGEHRDIELPDLFTPYLVVRASGKVRSFDFGDEEFNTKGNTSIFLALSTNALEVYSYPPPTKEKTTQPEATRTLSVELPGHRTDVRSLCLSSDDMLLASASNGKTYLDYCGYRD
jgi:U3 small nucleolar RNA-associated protein 12